jgi:hypothetical protein
VPETATERIHIDAPPARCLEVALDVEAYPRWARDVKQVTVHRRDGDGRPLEVEFRAAAMGRSTRYVLAYDHTGLPRSFAWHLVESDMLRALDGSYTFDPDGPGTRVTYDLAVDPKIPLPGLIKRRAAGLIIGTALRELKKEVERGDA